MDEIAKIWEGYEEKLYQFGIKAVIVVTSQRYLSSLWGNLLALTRRV